MAKRNRPFRAPTAPTGFYGESEGMVGSAAEGSNSMWESDEAGSFVAPQRPLNQSTAFRESPSLLSSPSAQESIAGISGATPAIAETAESLGKSPISSLVQGVNLGMAGVGLATDIIGTIMQYNAQQEQMGENARVERLNQQEEQRLEKKGDKRYAAQMRLSIENRDYNRKVAEENVASQKEAQQYSRRWDYLNRMASQMNQNMAWRDRLIALNSRRAA